VIKPHVNVPFEDVDKYLHFIKQARPNLEIYFGSQIIEDVTIDDVISLREKLDYGPEYSIHAPYMDLSPGAIDPGVRKITVKRFNDIFSFAEILKPVVVVFHSGYEKWKYGKKVDIWLEQSIKTWKPIAKRAEDAGIKIAIENIFEDEPSNLRMLVDEINSKNFGLCFDTGHFNLFTNLDLNEWLAMIKNSIFELHLHDNKKTEDSHSAIGDGNFDFNTLFKEVKGMDIIYTIEAHTVGDVKKSMSWLQTYALDFV
jgi:sugar phosphate isomerase/epimerase